MISNKFYSFSILKNFFVILIFTNKVFAANKKVDDQSPDYNSTFDNSFLHVISTFEHDIIQWINVKDNNSINYSLISPDDVELLSKACENDYNCRQKKINSLNNLKTILESLECFHVYLSLKILNIFDNDITKKKENPNHKLILGYEYVRDYAVKMISFFTYGKFKVNPWQLDFSMNVINMIRLENDKKKSFEDILVYINDPSLLSSMNEFCENCKRSNKFFASFNSVLSNTFQYKPDPFRIPRNVKSYIKNIMSNLKIDCVINLDKISHKLIKKENMQEIKIDPNFEKKKHNFLKSLTLSKHEIETYQRNTACDTNSQLRKKDMGKRLQASYFHRACTMQPTTCSKKIMEKMLHTNKKNEVIETDETDETKNDLYRSKYGINNEKEAIKEFRNEMNVEIQSCGVFIDENLNYLSASPDGLVGNDGIIEVKCPFIARDMTPEDAIKSNNIRYAYFDNNGNLLLKCNSQQFYQVQGELHITKKQYCYFIIWTQKGMIYTKIIRDDKFWIDHMENQLIDFYENRMLPELISLYED